MACSGCLHLPKDILKFKKDIPDHFPTHSLALMIAYVLIELLKPADKTAFISIDLCLTWRQRAETLEPAIDQAIQQEGCTIQLRYDFSLPSMSYLFLDFADLTGIDSSL